MVDYKADRTKGLVVTTQDYIPPHRSQAMNRELHDFFELIVPALQEHQDRDGIPRDRQLKFRMIKAKDPIDKVDTDISMVVARVISRKPWNTSPDRERRVLRPQQREVFQHPDKSNFLVIQQGMVYENIVEFRVTSADASKAIENAYFFEQFMYGWLFYFKDLGVKNIWYRGWEEAEVEEIGGQEFYVYPIRFAIETETLYHSVQSKIQEVTLEYDVGEEITTEVINQELGIKKHSITDKSGD